MLAACLWSRWINPDKNKPDLLSLALITDEPPAEVRARGHDRCIIPIREKYVDAWLNPQGDVSMSQQILSDRAGIPMNSVQHSGSSRYGIPVQAGTVIHRQVGVG